MSYMNTLETNARNYVAMSILNSFRHWLLGRADSVFSDKHAEIFLDSVDMNDRDAGADVSSRMILYSFKGLANNDRSAAVDLSDALSKALSSEFKDSKEKLLDTIKEVVKARSLEKLRAEERTELLSLVGKTMKIVSSSSRRTPTTAIKWKTI